MIESLNKEINDVYELKVSTTQKGSKEETVLWDSFNRWSGYMRLYLSGVIPFEDVQKIERYENKILQKLIGRNLFNGN